MLSKKYLDLIEIKEALQYELKFPLESLTYEGLQLIVSKYSEVLRMINIELQNFIGNL